NRCMLIESPGGKIPLFLTTLDNANFRQRARRLAADRGQPERPPARRIGVRRLVGLFCLLAGSMLGQIACAAEPVDYNRQVKPILAGKCFACHGPDAETRKAGLRLDTREGALAETESGGFAIVPHKP